MRKLLVLPVTLPLGAVRGAVRGAFDVLESALDGDGPVPYAPPAPPAPASAPPAPAPPASEPRAAAPPPPAPPALERPPVRPGTAPAASAELAEELADIADELGFVDAHVDEPEDELVESEGAADPGPALRVSEPWDGYEHLRAPDIVDRLAAADAATKAVVRLYESTHRARKSVLAATEE